MAATLESQAQALFEQLDVNGDGQVSIAEFKALWARSQFAAPTLVEQPAVQETTVQEPKPRVQESVYQQGTVALQRPIYVSAPQSIQSVNPLTTAVPPMPIQTITYSAPPQVMERTVSAPTGNVTNAGSYSVPLNVGDANTYSAWPPGAGNVTYSGSYSVPPNGELNTHIGPAVSIYTPHTGGIVTYSGSTPHRSSSAQVLQSPIMNTPARPYKSSSGLSSISPNVRSYSASIPTSLTQVFPRTIPGVKPTAASASLPVTCNTSPAPLVMMGNSPMMTYAAQSAGTALPQMGSGTFAHGAASPPMPQQSPTMTYAAQSAGTPLAQMGSGTFAQGATSPPMPHQAPAARTLVVNPQAIYTAQPVKDPGPETAVETVAETLAQPPIVIATPVLQDKAINAEFKKQVLEAFNQGNETVNISMEAAVEFLEKGIPEADPKDPKHVKISKARKKGGGCC